MNHLGASFTLARRYLRQHPAQTLLLVAALSLLLALPLVLRVLLRQAEAQLHARAASTPLVLGARASALDLVLSALHFRLPPPPAITLADTQQAAALNLASVLPLHLGHNAQGAPVVGTELDYFSRRHLRLQQGTLFLRLGDCVLGSALAEDRALGPGDSLISSPTQAFNPAGAYPLKMRITGVLAPSGSPDDHAVFVDLKTAWLMDGLAHGHDDLARASDAEILSQSSDNIVANASVRLFNEVTPQNLASFHFHGDASSFPVTAALVFPHDDKSDALMSGRYRKNNGSLQLISPVDWVKSLMDTLFKLENLLLLLLAATGIAALLVIALVFALSFRLRRREFQTLADLGIPPGALVAVKLLEVTLIFLMAAALAALAVSLAQQAAPGLLRAMMH